MLHARCANPDDDGQSWSFCWNCIRWLTSRSPWF